MGFASSTAAAVSEIPRTVVVILCIRPGEYQWAAADEVLESFDCFKIRPFDRITDNLLGEHLDYSRRLAGLRLEASHR